jgi:hypothetical protein
MIGFERATLTHPQAAPDFFLVVRRLHPGETLLFTFEVNGNIFFLRLAKFFFLARPLVDFIGPPVKRRFVAFLSFLPFQVYMDLPGPHSQEDDRGTDGDLHDHSITPSKKYRYTFDSVKLIMT